MVKPRHHPVLVVEDQVVKEGKAIGSTQLVLSYVFTSCSKVCINVVFGYFVAISLFGGFNVTLIFF